MKTLCLHKWHSCRTPVQALFGRLFKKEMGKTFSDYVADFKMTVAKELLENTDLSVTDISNDLGFSDSGYFIKIFKKRRRNPAIFANT